MSKLQPSPEVLRLIDVPRRLSAGTEPASGPATGLAAGAGLGALLLAGCLSANVGMDESGTIVLSTASSGETSGDAASSGASGIMTTTEDPEHTTSDSTETAPGTGTEGDTSGSETTGTTAIPVACGDGELQDGEECDAGQANADEGACTKYCKAAVCGDGLVQAGVEVCDDNVNDGSYGVCGVDCKTPAATCGDGTVQAPEEQCDDAAAQSGCLPEACIYAESCKQIRDAFDEVADGVYTIAPKGTKLSVVCDMDADTGGYTFLKLAQPAPVDAKTAEIECAKYGMRLLVPRSKVHLAAAVQVAQSEVLAPIGAGLKSSVDYLKIFGIYPKMAGQSCAGQPLNNVDCPEWSAFGDIFWVTDQVFGGQPGTNTCTKCSLAYYWSGTGTLDWIESVSEFNKDSKSALFMCEVPDMLPPK